MKFNREKAELRKTEISFLGHLVPSDGLKIDPEKVEAFLKMPKPEYVEGVRRFCISVSYLPKFLPKLSDVLEPIRQLTRSETEWNWTSTHDKTFETVQKLVTEAPTLAFYNPQEELVIQREASQTGLGAVLMQMAVLLRMLAVCCPRLTLGTLRLKRRCWPSFSRSGISLVFV